MSSHFKDVVNRIIHYTSFCRKTNCFYHLEKPFWLSIPNKNGAVIPKSSLFHRRKVSMHVGNHLGLEITITNVSKQFLISDVFDANPPPKF